MHEEDTSAGRTTPLLTLRQARSVRSALREVGTHLWESQPMLRDEALAMFRALPRDMSRFDSEWSPAGGLLPRYVPTTGEWRLALVDVAQPLITAALTSALQHFTASSEIQARLCGSPAELRQTVRLVNGETTLASPPDSSPRPGTIRGAPDRPSIAPAAAAETTFPAARPARVALDRSRRPTPAAPAAPQIVVGRPVTGLPSWGEDIWGGADVALATAVTGG